MASDLAVQQMQMFAATRLCAHAVTGAIAFVCARNTKCPLRHTLLSEMRAINPNMISDYITDRPGAGGPEEA